MSASTQNIFLMITSLQKFSSGLETIFRESTHLNSNMEFKYGRIYNNRGFSNEVCSIRLFFFVESLSPSDLDGSHQGY